jgi:hypothetical protein
MSRIEAYYTVWKTHEIDRNEMPLLMGYFDQFKKKKSIAAWVPSPSTSYDYDYDYDQDTASTSQN